MAQHWAMHTPLCPGRVCKASTLLQRCTFLAHEEATLPCVSHCDNNLIIPVTVAVAIAIAVAVSVVVAIAVAIGRCRCRSRRPSPLPSPSAITIAVAIGHCRCHCYWPSLLPLPLPLPLAIAVAVAVTVAIAIAVSAAHCRCHHHCKRHLPRKRRRPSLESCCLGAAIIIFKQFKQIMLTLFYFVWTVSSALIAADD
jgi:hypothetical protein